MTRKEFGQLVRSWRKEKGLSQVEFGRQFEIDQSAVSRIEQGIQHVPIEMALAMVAYLEIPRWKLFGSEESEGAA